MLAHTTDLNNEPAITKANLSHSLFLLKWCFLFALPLSLVRMYVYLGSHITLSMRNRQEDQLIFVSAYSVALHYAVLYVSFGVFYAYIESPKIKQNCLIQGI